MGEFRIAVEGPVSGDISQSFILPKARLARMGACSVRTSTGGSFEFWNVLDDAIWIHPICNM